MSHEGEMDSSLSLEQLSILISILKGRGLTVALANGGFDLLHVGHIRYLREAAKTADILVVALNSDASLRKLKGPGRPLLSQKERAMMINAVENVDYVTVFDEPTVENVLRTLTPHVHCKGGDYTPDTVPERDVVKSFGGRIAIVGGDKVRSTSWVIRDLERPR